MFAGLQTEDSQVFLEECTIRLHYYGVYEDEKPNCIGCELSGDFGSVFATRKIHLVQQYHPTMEVTEVLEAVARTLLPEYCSALATLIYGPLKAFMRSIMIMAPHNTAPVGSANAKPILAAVIIQG
ncbi:hypothetical protein PR048_029981 [Dryococelus australis]|uniref:Uncharacterized protein n=1 Tax=Dryococelus australis TaxID=614101 RepID=A0ABQ9GAJ3_9NEOP|nr:hypothetical protein PR048_029981 [Dryococelus australis]